MLRVVTDDDARAELTAGLDEIVREGARRMLAAAIEAEADGYGTAFADERDEHGRRLVVLNGHAEPRTIVTAAGGIEIQAPRVNDRRVDEVTGERQRFKSMIVPAWCRKSPKVSEVALGCPTSRAKTHRRVDQNARAEQGRVIGC